MLFETGRWDDALAEVAALPENLKEPGAACADLGIAAVISFHRGEIAAARRNLEATVPHAKLVGHRLIASLAVARSLDCEHAGALAEARAALTREVDDDADVLEIEELLADAVRLAARTGDLSAARSLAARAAVLADGSQIPHRQANALYCRGLVEHNGTRLLAAAARYRDASRPLMRAKAFEAAAGEFARAGDGGQARAALTGAMDLYASLAAAFDIARLRKRRRP